MDQVRSLIVRPLVWVRPEAVVEPAFVGVSYGKKMINRIV
jgi:hypothetical protein